MVYLRMLYVLTLCYWGPGLLGQPTYADVGAVPGKAEDPALSFSLRWHGRTVSLRYDPAMFLSYPVPVEERALRQAYDRLAGLPYMPLLLSLREQASALGLNDWLYYQLLDEALRELYPDALATNRDLTAYLLLAQSGFDPRLTYLHERVQLNVYTEETLYEIPLIQEDGRQYANLRPTDRPFRRGQSMYLLNHRPNPRGRPFLFRLLSWPHFPQQPRERLLAFRYAGETHELRVTYDQTAVQLLADYPLLDEAWYHEAPLSGPLRGSLLPALKEMLGGKSKQEALELLVAFTRSGFVYREDHRVFGGSKPMVPDEVFHYTYSDCEDRTALFCALVRELLGLPTIIIAYEDHLSVAVAAADVPGAGINYQGRRYVFCDPTGPYHSSTIGVVPDGYENAGFRIIGSYE